MGPGDPADLADPGGRVAPAGLGHRAAPPGRAVPAGISRLGQPVSLHNGTAGVSVCVLGAKIAEILPSAHIQSRQRTLMLDFDIRERPHATRDTIYDTSILRR
jgi:hypothetical protein